MALTGKTIGQLTLLSEVSEDVLFPVELSGDTYHIVYSGISHYTETTYEELYNLYTGSSLSAGKFYLISDYQTCYDQPNYDSEGNAITSGNYKTATTEPLLVFATSSTGFSPTAYSTIYSKDKITYDISWNLTEVTNSPAKGRIIERIDEKNNRADYDFRGVQFIRYFGFFSENQYTGKLNIDSVGNVVGTNTTFDTDFIVGDILGVKYNNSEAPLGSFRYYEILTISASTAMTVTGTTISVGNSLDYSKGIGLPQYMSPFQCNITSSAFTGSSEYFTFVNDDNYNTYLGDNQNYNTFILSNNVFQSGVYRNNYFAGNVVGNTFNDDMDSNTCGPSFQFNIITNDFDKNNVHSFFNKNIIDCDFSNNVISDQFYGNMLGDRDGFDFDLNNIGSYFYSNFFTMNNGDFRNNTVNSYFYNNFIEGEFFNSQVEGEFYDNRILTSFNDNNCGYTFYSNEITNSFNNNNVGKNFYGNNLTSTLFTDNIIGANFTQNTITGGTFQSNKVGYNFDQNNITGNFSYNHIADNFVQNTVLDGFGFGGASYRGNVIGNNFASNNIREYFYSNTITDNFTNNIIGDYFQNNTVTYNGLNSFNFTTYLGIIQTVSSVGGTGGTDGTYTAISQTSTDRHGSGAEFTVEVGGGSVTGLTVTSGGTQYSVGEVLTITGTSIGGATDLIITVSTISDDPLVYTTSNCTISNSRDNTVVISTLDLATTSIYVSDEITGPYNP